MQRAYISKLMELAEKDDRICQLLADSGTSFDEMFQRNFPGRMFNFGIAEQNTIGIAAGMASSGKIPFVFLQGAFIAYRAMEFVRDDVCFQNMNVKLIGQGSGISLTGLGPTHHTTEDIAVLRALPNLMIYSPATPIQTGVVTEEIYKIKGPCYMRIGMNNEKEFFDSVYSLPETGQDIMCEGGDIVIITTGSILEEVMEAVELFKNDGLHVSVVNVVRIKPFFEENIIKLSKMAKHIFTVEEHQIFGGLGSIVSEIVASQGLGIPVSRIGFNDAFALGYASSLKALRKENKLDAMNLRERILHDCGL